MNHARRFADPSVSLPDDIDIARRIAAGDRAAFELLMRRHNQRLYRLARATLRNDADAEEVLQDAYLSAHRGIDRFRGESTLATWLFSMVRNECLGRLRKSARRHHLITMEPSDEMQDVHADACDAPEAALARAEMRALLERKVDELPEDFRIVFVLRSVEELSVEETASGLGIEPATVRSRHFRARSLLREALAREIDVAERNLFDFAGARCDRIVAAVTSRLDG